MSTTKGFKVDYYKSKLALVEELTKLENQRDDISNMIAKKRKELNELNLQNMTKTQVDSFTRMVKKRAKINGDKGAKTL